MIPVILLTIHKKSSTRPFAHAIYANINQALQSLREHGINPGYGPEFPIINGDGERSSMLYVTPKWEVSMAVIPMDMAIALTNDSPMCPIPDVMEEV